MLQIYYGNCYLLIGSYYWLKAMIVSESMFVRVKTMFDRVKFMLVDVISWVL